MIEDDFGHILTATPTKFMTWSERKSQINPRRCFGNCCCFFSKKKTLIKKEEIVYTIITDKYLWKYIVKSFIFIWRNRKKKWEEHWINKTVLSAMRIIIYIEIWNSAVFGVLISKFTACCTAMTWKLTRKSHQTFTPASNWIQLVFSFFYSYTFSCELQTHFSSVQNVFYSTVFSFIFSFFVSFGWDWAPSKCFLIENDFFWVDKGIWIDWVSHISWPIFMMNWLKIQRNLMGDFAGRNFTVKMTFH